MRLFPYVCSPAVTTPFMDQQVSRLTLMISIKLALSNPNCSEVDDADGAGGKALSASTGLELFRAPSAADGETCAASLLLNRVAVSPTVRANHVKGT